MIACGIRPKTEIQATNKRNALKLVAAYAVAVKHYLRNEHGTQYPDFTSLLCFNPVDETHVPFEIILQLQGFLYTMAANQTITGPFQTQILNMVSAMIETLSSFERVSSTPIPAPYAIHLKLTLLIYLFALPFQIWDSAGYFTIPIVAIAAFTFLGVEAIGSEIENPFGYDVNDLKCDEYTLKMVDEVSLVCKKLTVFDGLKWSALGVGSLGA